MDTTVTVYCASARNLDSIYTATAAELGRALAQRGIRLVTGGGATGLMGAVENGALEAGGEATGIIPEFMYENGWQHKGLSHLEIVRDMHARKSRMAALADAVIALPGGIGTFEELLEIITWRQLGLYHGTVVIFNVNNYYAPLLSMFEQAINWPDLLMVSAGIMLTGILICTLASALATNRYLRQGYDEMFMK